MAHVLELNPVVDDAVDETTSHRRIRAASRVLSAVFWVIFVFYCVFGAALVSAFIVPYAGDHLLIGPKGMLLYLAGPVAEHAPALPPAGYVSVAGLPPIQRLAHVAVAPIVALPGLMIFWNLRQLFRLYGQGTVFAEANARRIKHLGLWLVASALQPLVTTTVLAAVHMRIDQNWFHGDTIPKIVLGGVVYVIGMVMAVGHEIEQVRGQFV
jgi:hypothetical protein